MRRLLLALGLCIALSGCTATAALKAATDVLAPTAKPELTVQAGAENVKQHLGLVARRDETVTVRENTGPVTVKAERKPQAIQSENLHADAITLNQSEPWPLLAGVLAGLLPPLALLFWTLPRPKWCRKREANG